MPWPAAVNQLSNHLDRSKNRHIALYFSEDWVARIWISCEIASLALFPICTHTVLVFSYVYKNFYLLLLDSCWQTLVFTIFTSATTVLHNDIIIEATDCTNTHFIFLPWCRIRYRLWICIHVIILIYSATDSDCLNRYICLTNLSIPSFFSLYTTPYHPLVLI